MSVYASTAAVRRPRNLWAVLDAFAAAGIRSVELGFVELDPTDAAQLTPRLRASGFELLVHNYFPPFADRLVLNLASPDDEVARASVDFVLQSLGLAAELGAPFYSVHAGFLTDPVRFDRTGYVLPPASPGAQAPAAERFAENVGRVLDRAEALGIGLLVENHACTEADRGKLLLLEPDEVARFFERFAGRDLGLLLDTGHLNVTATTLGFDRDELVDAVAAHVRAFHLHENGGAVDEHLPPREGDWALAVVRRPPFDGLPVVVEATFEDAASLVGYVKRLELSLAHGAEAAR